MSHKKGKGKDAMNNSVKAEWKEPPKEKRPATLDEVFAWRARFAYFSIFILFVDSVSLFLKRNLHHGLPGRRSCVGSPGPSDHQSRCGRCH